jgi:hypothetical protein
MSLANRAMNIARLEFNARFNNGQRRITNAMNMALMLKNNYGNNAVNNALVKARSIVRKTHRRQQQRVNNVVRTAATRFINARGAARERAGRALMRGVVRELNNLRYVPINTFRVKRGRSPSPLRSPSAVKKARRYVGSD